ncbi:hypothetical protein BDA99DRAFT_512410 [Phascolomyces articulosus]|uniref:ER membrane protein complex subunit 7 beta-sandwich domain-containing protein n=1 Tax=Phascolomyces articulosus TaxID=60185 RepID=A0AAD5JY85_9FUNG|nr:hypothetical protein BDA99DRAFT_512410 [Phascolomyces articulosus]
MVKASSIFILVATWLVALVESATVTGSIAINGILPNVQLLRPTTRVSLNGDAYSTLVKANGQFEITDVDTGSYMLEVHAIDYVFPRLRLDIDKEQGITRASYTGYGASFESRGYSVDQPLELRAKAPAIYFVERKGFNVLAMFKNPMFLMIGFSALMMFVLPKLMANMDPEALKEMSQSQADAQKMISDMPSLSDMFSNARNQQQQQQQQRRR